MPTSASTLSGSSSKAGTEARERLALLGSPVLGFLQDKCELHPDKSIPKDVIYGHYCRYAAANGLQRLGSGQFFSALYAAAGGKVRATKKWHGGRQVPSVLGIDMNAEAKANMGPDEVPDEELPF
jgi:hypothetical protein